MPPDNPYPVRHVPDRRPPSPRKRPLEKVIGAPEFVPGLIALQRLSGQPEEGVEDIHRVAPSRSFWLSLQVRF